MELIEIYNLKNEKSYINDVQDATLHTDKFGLKIEYGLLFGREEWFEAIKCNKIKPIMIDGIITNVRSVGQNNDSREFQVTNTIDGSTNWWGAKGKWDFYKVGKMVRAIYVIQRYKRPDSVLGESTNELISLEIEI